MEHENGRDISDLSKRGRLLPPIPCLSDFNQHAHNSWQRFYLVQFSLHKQPCLAMAASTAMDCNGDLNSMTRQVCRPPRPTLLSSRHGDIASTTLFTSDDMHACLPSFSAPLSLDPPPASFHGSSWSQKTDMYECSSWQDESVECGSCWVRCDESSSW